MTINDSSYNRKKKNGKGVINAAKASFLAQLKRDVLTPFPKYVCYPI